jgi:hypothetical protein
MLNHVITKSVSLYWNRWSNYAFHLLPVFECTKGLKYARVALTVGIDTDSTFGNNRIGSIIVFIERPPKQLSHKSKLRHLMKQMEEKVTQNYKDCISTYDGVRCYDTTLLRKFMTTTGVDVVITSMFSPIEVKSIAFALGAFIGNEYEYPFFYINSTTLCDTNYTTFTTNWKQFNHKKYVKDFGAKLIYTFA